MLKKKTRLHDKRSFQLHTQNKQMASLTALHRDLSEKMSTKRLHQFVSDEVRNNTQSLLDTMSALDTQLQRVQHDSGIRARFYNDPVGDWQINDNPELLPAGVNVSTKGRASYVTFSQQNNATRLKLRNLFDQVDKDKDGYINVREMLIALRTNSELSELLQLPSRIRQENGSREAFENVFQEMDSDGDGDRLISYTEFIGYVTKNSEPLPTSTTTSRPKSKPNYSPRSTSNSHSNFKPPPPFVPPPPQIQDINEEEVQKLLRSNKELAQALYLKERETLELRALGEENMILRRRNEEIEQENFGPEPDYVVHRGQVALVRQNNAQIELDQKKKEIQHNIRSRMKITSGARQYNNLVHKVALDLQRKNTEKTKSARNHSTSRPPTWAVSPTKANRSTPLWIQAEEQLEQEKLKSMNNYERRIKNKNKNKKFVKAKKVKYATKQQGYTEQGRYQREQQGYASKERGSTSVRGRFKNIEMSFGELEVDGEIDSDEEDILNKYPIARRRNRSNMVGGGNNNQRNESDDMRAYRRRLREKKDRGGKLQQERQRAQDFWLR